MPNMPSVELLESTHVFPCNYMFKAIGEDHHAFTGRVLAAVRQETAEDNEPAMHTRRSASGRHISVTVEPFVTDAQQVLAIYERMAEIDGLVMLW